MKITSEYDGSTIIDLYKTRYSSLRRHYNEGTRDLLISDKLDIVDTIV